MGMPRWLYTRIDSTLSKSENSKLLPTSASSKKKLKKKCPKLPSLYGFN
jgi:hypothetical protein